MLYSSAKPQTRLFGCCSVTLSPSSLIVVVEVRDGIDTPS
jgi:hypothetical protein